MRWVHETAARRRIPRCAPSLPVGSRRGDSAGVGGDGSRSPIQSVANTVRNAIALLDRLGRVEAAAPLVGWYAAHPAIIPGTPGMRAHVDDLRARLPALVEPTRLAVLLAEGEALDIDEVLSVARRALR